LLVHLPQRRSLAFHSGRTLARRATRGAVGASHLGVMRSADPQSPPIAPITARLPRPGPRHPPISRSAPGRSPLIGSLAQPAAGPVQPSARPRRPRCTRRRRSPTTVPINRSDLARKRRGAVP
jgi:hypothetical protein